MTDAILYARYSTALQSEASVDDQFRLLRDRAVREGWNVLGQYSDRAISGTVKERAGLAAAMQAIETREAKILLAESLDRLSRDQEDLANLFKRVRFAGARIFTASEGEIGTIQIGMGGTMSALFLEQLAEKVRRGHVGRVKAGRIPGGLSYGYRKVRAFRDDGEPERGLREIDQGQAEIVRRIFNEYADGRSPIEIARQLNSEGVVSPRGGLWRANAIQGNRRRGNGVIHNELYIGRIVYNRQSFRKDPETRKRVSRGNPADDVVCQEVPDLRIIDQELWNRAQARISELADKPLNITRRKKRLFSGLVKCGECGGPVIIISTDRWGCSAYRQTGTCSNNATLKDDILQKRVWSAIRENLLHPDVIAAYLDEFRIAWAEERRRRIAARADFERRLQVITEQEARIADAVIAGIDPATLKAKADSLAASRAAIEKEGGDMPDIDPTVAHPTIIAAFRKQVAELATIAATDRDTIDQARPLLASLIDHIAMDRRADGKRGAELTLHGDLAQLLGIPAPERKKPANPEGSSGQSMLSMVAGERFSRKHSFAIAA